MKAGALVAALVAGASAGCFGSEPAPLAPTAPRREPIASVERPHVLGATPFDYAALPVIEVGEEADPRGTRPDRLASVPLDGSTPLALELSAGDLTMYTWPKDGPPAPQPGWAACAPDLGRSASVARAEGFVVSTRMPERAEVVMAVGLLDYARCRFEAGREARAVAPAILPGVLYAVRACWSGCRHAPGDDRRREVITLFGPPATWITSNHPDASVLTQTKVGPFSRISLPVTRGGSASAAFTVEPAALLAFQRQTAAPTTRDLAQYTVEILWSEADPAPLATAFVATLPPGDPQADGARASRPATP